MLVSDWPGQPCPTRRTFLRGTCGVGKTVRRGPVTGCTAQTGPTTIRGTKRRPTSPRLGVSFLLLAEVGLVMAGRSTLPQLPGRATLGLLRLHAQTANTDAPPNLIRRGVSCRLSVERQVWTPSAFVVKLAAMASVAWTSATGRGGPALPAA
jgi:hypothetical protein